MLLNYRSSKLSSNMTICCRFFFALNVEHIALLLSFEKLVVATLSLEHCNTCVTLSLLLSKDYLYFSLESSPFCPTVISGNICAQQIGREFSVI